MFTYLHSQTKTFVYPKKPFISAIHFGFLLTD